MTSPCSSTSSTSAFQGEPSTRSRLGPRAGRRVLGRDRTHGAAPLASHRMVRGDARRSPGSRATLAPSIPTDRSSGQVAPHGLAAAGPDRDAPSGRQRRHDLDAATRELRDGHRLATGTCVQHEIALVRDRQPDRTLEIAEVDLEARLRVRAMAFAASSDTQRAASLACLAWPPASSWPTTHQRAFGTDWRSKGNHAEECTPGTYPRGRPAVRSTRRPFVAGPSPVHRGARATAVRSNRTFVLSPRPQTPGRHPGSLQTSGGHPHPRERP